MKIRVLAKNIFCRFKRALKKFFRVVIYSSKKYFANSPRFPELSKIAFIEISTGGG